MSVPAPVSDAPWAGPEPEFAVLGARPVRYAAAPMLSLDLQVSEPSGRQVYMIALHVQVMIEPARGPTTTPPAPSCSSCSASPSAGQ